MWMRKVFANLSKVGDGIDVHLGWKKSPLQEEESWSVACRKELLLLHPLVFKGSAEKESYVLL